MEQQQEIPDLANLSAAEIKIELFKEISALVEDIKELR